MEPKFQQDDSNIEDPALCLIDILLQRCKSDPSFLKAFIQWSTSSITDIYSSYTVAGKRLRII